MGSVHQDRNPAWVCEVEKGVMDRPSGYMFRSKYRDIKERTHYLYRCMNHDQIGMYWEVDLAHIEKPICGVSHRSYGNCGKKANHGGYHSSGVGYSWKQGELE